LVDEVVWALLRAVFRSFLTELAHDHRERSPGCGGEHHGIRFGHDRHATPVLAYNMRCMVY
jgi:hypothetical protein